MSQGSIFGPILLYVNDLPVNIQETVIFEDDKHSNNSRVRTDPKTKYTKKVDL